VHLKEGQLKGDLNKTIRTKSLFFNKVLAISFEPENLDLQSAGKFINVSLRYSQPLLNAFTNRTELYFLSWRNRWLDPWIPQRRRRRSSSNSSSSQRVTLWTMALEILA